MISDIFWEKFTDSYFPEAKKIYAHHRDYEKYLLHKGNNKIIINRELRQLDFDQMLAGKIAYTKKTENTYKNLCK